VAYYHVELRHHAIFLAENARAKSFLNDGCRGLFRHTATFDRLYPDTPTMASLQLRPEHGFSLPAMRDRIAAQTSVITPVEPTGPLRGFMDIATPARICGWARERDSTEAAVAPEVPSEFPRAVLACQQPGALICGRPGWGLAVIASKWCFPPDRPGRWRCVG
jgi:hypothetical protein